MINLQRYYTIIHSFIHSFTHSFIAVVQPSPYKCFYLTHATRALQREGINSGSHTYFFDHTRTWRASRMRDQLNAGATSETTRTWKTIHIIHSNKANMKGWFWQPNDIRGPCGPKASCHLSYRWGKTPKKPHPGNLSRSRIEPGPSAWEARMLPPVPQRWTRGTVLSHK